MARTIRFHLDECCDPAIADGLRRRSIDVTTSQELRLLHAAAEQQVAYGLAEKLAQRELRDVSNGTSSLSDPRFNNYYRLTQIEATNRTNRDRSTSIALIIFNYSYHIDHLSALICEIRGPLTMCTDILNRRSFKPAAESG